MAEPVKSGNITTAECEVRTVVLERNTIKCMMRPKKGNWYDNQWHDEAQRGKLKVSKHNDCMMVPKEGNLKFSKSNNCMMKPKKGKLKL